MGLLTFATLVVIGFTACAEFGSWAFVHPVLWKLPVEQHIRVEQGLLSSFGRAMPFLMPASSILAIAYAIDGPGIGTTNGLLRWAAAVAIGISIVTTVAVNVPGNFRTGRMKAQTLPNDWVQFRRRWDTLARALVMPCAVIPQQNCQPVRELNKFPSKSLTNEVPKALTLKFSINLI